MTQNEVSQPTSGIAVLADDVDFEDGPFPVQGVALPEEITTSGNAKGEEVYWPSDVVKEAAAMFEGAKITDPSEHDPQTAIENPQPSPTSILGEIEEAKYEPGTGVVYKGEIDDPEVAKRVERGRVEVSPTIFRTVSGDGEPKPVNDVKGVRDLSVVAEGQAEGNRIEPATAAMSALSAEALSSIFEESVTNDTGGNSGMDDETTMTTEDALEILAEEYSIEKESLAETLEKGEVGEDTGPRARELIEELMDAGMTQEEIGNRVDRSADTISAIANGEIENPPDSLIEDLEDIESPEGESMALVPPERETVVLEEA